jgi:hypothetical protein
LIFSLNKPKHKYFFVCSVITQDSTLILHETNYTNILAKINFYYNEQKRGKSHPMKGKMFAYGYRSERLNKNFGQYHLKKNIPSNTNLYNSWLDNIVCHYESLLKKYYPLLFLKYRQIQSKFHTPGIGDTYAGNLIVAHNFASAPHLDKMDVTYAFGIWYKYGMGTIDNWNFVFPEYDLDIVLHSGIIVLWNSEKAIIQQFVLNLKIVFLLVLQFNLTKFYVLKHIIYGKSSNNQIFFFIFLKIN